MPHQHNPDAAGHPLTKGLIGFKLLVQFQEDPVTEPADDTAVEWKTAFSQVATIVFPAQDIGTADRIALDKRMSFCPGRAIAEHAPRGSINAVRSFVYDKLAKERIPYWREEDGIGEIPAPA